MTTKRKWDLTSPRSLDAAAEWLRVQAGAQLVLVIRAEGIAFALDPQIKPADAVTMVEVAMPDGMRELEVRRREKRTSAKSYGKGKTAQELAADEKWNQERTERGL